MASPPQAEPAFLSPAGEQAWTRLRRHLDRADRFWLAVILTADRSAARTLRTRAEHNRRLRLAPFVDYDAHEPEQLAGAADWIVDHATTAPGCTWVRSSLGNEEPWLNGWRGLFYGLNGRRDLLRRTIGGLVIVAPPEAKSLAQREASDLWSVLDLLIELSPERAAPESTPPSISADVRIEAVRKPPQSALSLDDAPDSLLDEAQILLAMSPEALATTARNRTSELITAARAAGADETAAALLLAQAHGYDDEGDPAAALHLVRGALHLKIGRAHV